MSCDKIDIYVSFCGLLVLMIRNSEWDLDIVLCKLILFCIGLMVGDDYGYWSECFEMIGIGFCIIDVGIEYLIEK